MNEQTTRQEFDNQIKQAIINVYPLLADKPESLETIVTKTYDLLDKLSSHSEEMFLERSIRNIDEYFRPWCSGDLSYDIIHEEMFDIIFNELPYDIIEVDGKEYRDWDDAHVDAAYEITGLIELIYSNHPSIMTAAIPVAATWIKLRQEYWDQRKQQVMIDPMLAVVDPATGQIPRPFVKQPDTLTLSSVEVNCLLEAIAVANKAVENNEAPYAIGGYQSTDLMTQRSYAGVTTSIADKLKQFVEYGQTAFVVFEP